ncbi:MAG: ABC transporter ATP-binding protein [Candidatus Latescibacteria bacterium]|nr:ABC transporter ATP-binding protein [Candidatus Latescibacterota bacterium]
MEANKKILECTGVTKVFRTGFHGRVHALNNVNLTVNSGEIFGLLGPNGAGKTTLIRILLGLIYPGSGSVRLFDTDVKDHRIRSKVGYLPENPGFPPYLNGRQIMELYGSLAGIDSDVCTQKTDELLTMLNMDKHAGRKVTTYSKGMIQRLGLAQTLIHDPDIIFLDEPTDGVDPIGRRDIREVLLNLRKAGKTIFLNSHLLSEIEMVSDSVAIMDKGRIVASGNLDDLNGDSSHYSICCPNMKTEHLEALQKEDVVSAIEDDILDVAVDSLEQLNRVIDVLRDEGLLIKSVTPQKQSLESYFVDLIKDIREEEGNA